MRFLLWQAAWPSPIWQPNSFTDSPQFAYPCIIAAPYQGTLNPRIAFITGRIALIFQKPLPITTFFRILALFERKLFRFAQGNSSVSA